MGLNHKEVEVGLVSKTLDYEEIAECWENYEIIKVGTQYFKIDYGIYEDSSDRYIEDVTEVKPVEVKSIYWDEV